MKDPYQPPQHLKEPSRGFGELVLIGIATGLVGTVGGWFITGLFNGYPN